jgi:hypothetical protein
VKFNSYGCIPGKSCKCPRVYSRCTAWTALEEKAKTDEKAAQMLADLQAETRQWLRDLGKDKVR